MLFNRQNDSHISTIQTPCWKSPPPQFTTQKAEKTIEKHQASNTAKSSFVKIFQKNAQKVFLGLFFASGAEKLFQTRVIMELLFDQKKVKQFPPPPFQKTLDRPLTRTLQKTLHQVWLFSYFPCALKYQNVFEPDEL